MNEANISNKRKINILAVDDGDIELKLMGYYLSQIQSWDITCFQAKDTAGALEIIDSQHIDACLLDYHLGAETGVELAEKIHALGYTTACIIVTGLDTDELETLVHAKGFNHVLAKEQMSASSLEAVIGSLL
ncbi:response regulator [Glaciecola siphonariae]|uniref:Response regulator n=1 Tax=Glaciecola siphonariae TaxID=521012 RepID=A0ABV9LZN4_9ALTE